MSDNAAHRLESWLRYGNPRPNPLSDEGRQFENDLQLILAHRAPLTEEAVERAANAYEGEIDRWRTRAYLPARNGMEITAWMEVQRNATYDLLRREDDGSFTVIEPGLQDALGEPELFRRRRIEATKAALLAAGWTGEQKEGVRT